MRLNRISVKLGVTIISLLLVVLLPLGFVINEIVSGFYYDQVEDEIDKLSSRYANAITNSENIMMVPMVETMAEFSDVKLFTVDENGQIIVSSSVPGLVPGNVISEEQRKSLLEGESSQGEYKDPTTGNQFLVSGKPIYMGETFVGGVYVLSSVENMNRSIYQLRQMFILSGTGAFLLALGMILVLSRKLSDPLVQMEKATRKIAKGELETRVKITSNDESGSLAQAINDLAVDLKRYRDTRQEFFANISHELRTPMTYLEGYANILKEGLYQTEEERIHYLDIIHKESKRVTRLIEDLFELSKIEEGKLSLHKEAIDLQEVLENVIQKVNLKAKEKGVDLVFQVEDGIESVYGDGLRMEQIFSNLLDNAIRYTEKGTVKVTVAAMKSEYVKITIEDTGQGIPKDELPYIFERFYRVEKSRSRDYGGTGLGLSIVKNLIELQDGSIQVASEVGSGTRFKVSFPSTETYEREGEQR
ncbi:sensor histidine kinase [Alkalihalobacillus deserti]|uniref:sensor histidine kinase n=1 Tax=Alkalihalobacillus deserti TaxID=2879466 RepID=UPI001D15DDE6|nr:sensor histidine kinase [Alkalihalobacillus deserti]